MIKVMVVMNDQGYLAKKVRGGKRSRHVFRDWWTVKWVKDDRAGFDIRSTVLLPDEYAGKRVRLRIEVVDPPKLLGGVDPLVEELSGR